MASTPENVSAQRQRQAQVYGWIVLAVIAIVIGAAMNQSQNGAHTNQPTTHCKELGKQQWHGAADNQKVLDYIDECK